MAFFTAYFDESDTPRAGVVAGCVLSVEQIDPFNREWLELLAEYELSSFHMNEFVQSKLEFTSWRGREQRRKEFIQRIVGIIARRGISIGVVVDRQDFDDFVCTPERRRFFKNIYTTASYMCLFLSGRWADKHGHGNPIKYVFDDGNSRRGDFESAYSASKEIPDLENRYRLGQLSFEDDKTVPPLQAADFVAYEISKFWTDKSHREPRRSLMEAMDKICHGWRIVTPEMLGAIARDAGID